MLAADTPKPPPLITLVMLTGLATLSGTMFLPSLSTMAREFEVEYGVMTLAISGYLAITAALQLVMGPLSDRYGRRPVALGALGLFAAASTGCALAEDITVFLGFRLLQGAVIAGWALSQAMVRDTTPPQQAASRIGYISMAMAIAPMLGPSIGGLLQEGFGWRASFWAFAAMGAGLLTLCWVDLEETNRTPSSTLGHQLRAYPELLRSRRFWGYALCMAFSVSAFHAFLAGVPLLAETALAIPPARLGLYMGSITVGFFLGSFVSGRYAGRHALTSMMIAGRLAACGGLFLGVIAALAGHVNELTFFGATIFVGVGNGLTMPSSSAGAVSVRPDLAGSAAGLAGALTVGVGAALTFLTGAILDPVYGPLQLLLIMLASSAIGLAAALAALSEERREGHRPPAAPI